MPSCNPFSFTKGKYVLPKVKVTKGLDSTRSDGRITVFPVRVAATQNGHAHNNNYHNNNNEEVSAPAPVPSEPTPPEEQESPVSATRESQVRFRHADKPPVPARRHSKEEPPKRRQTAFISAADAPKYDTDDDEEEREYDVGEHEPTTMNSNEETAAASTTALLSPPLPVFERVRKKSSVVEIPSPAEVTAAATDRVSFEARDPEEFLESAEDDEHEYDRTRHSYQIEQDVQATTTTTTSSSAADNIDNIDKDLQTKATTGGVRFNSEVCEHEDNNSGSGSGGGTPARESALTLDSTRSSSTTMTNERSSSYGSVTSSELKKKDMTVSDLVQRGPADQLGGSSKMAVRKEGVLSQPVDDGEETLSKEAVEIIDKDEASRALIETAITANEFLRNIMYDDRLAKVIDAMSPKRYDSGSYVINEGEVGSHLYVSASGNFEVFKDGKVVKTFGPGVAFGELAILYKARRFASIRVTTSSLVWTLERKVFSRIMIGSQIKEQEANVRFLCSVPLFQDVHPVEINRICDILKREFYQTGTSIVKQGEAGDKFYIIRGGSVEVTKRKSDMHLDEAAGVLTVGDYFGEQALIHKSVRLATVTALAPGVECLTLDRTAFIELLGNLKDLKEKKYPGMSDGKESGQQSTYVVKKVVDKDYDHIQFDDLEVVGTLGVGGFGRVELVRHTPKDGEGRGRDGATEMKTYALKCLQKVDIVQQQQQQHVYNEKDVMANCDSPFIVKLYKTFRDSKYLYFLMEACLGGDVWTALHKARNFDERTARFMTACVVEAFEYLHTRDMIYRDLKPENLMLDNRGYIKLVDFGFAKRVNPGHKAWTFAGTPEYVAPEVIQNRGHDRAVDYWAIGVFIHELLVGKPPFRGSDNMRTYHQILKGIDQVPMSHKVGRRAQELIRKLCRPIPAERLGYQKNGLLDIKNHPWYTSASFDWESLRAQTMPAPLVRPVHSPVDLSNFDKFARLRDFPPDEMSGFDVNF